MRLKHKEATVLALGGLGTAYLSYCGMRTYGIVPFRFNCPFWLLTGLSCPLCGMTRSIARLLAGDVQQSLILHPLGLVAFVALVSLALVSLSMLLRTRIRIRGP